MLDLAWIKTWDITRGTDLLLLQGNLSQLANIVLN